MTGQIELLLRIFLFWLCGKVADVGVDFIAWDPAAGVLTIDVTNLPALLAGIIGPFVVYQWSRLAKRAGRAT